MFRSMRTALVSRLKTACKFSRTRRLLLREDGIAAVEFALIAAPFLALTFAILETALVFFAGQYLETVVADSSRLILTGQAQKAGWDQNAFLQQVCAKIVGLFGCAGLMVDVRTYTNFASTNTSLPIDSKGNLQNSFVFQPGKQGDIVVTRLMYQWPSFVNIPGLNSLNNLSNGHRLLMATAAFRNEPYN
jgi:Flp pilus assembly protein TadG